jgi:hypothetical protein
MPFMNLIGQPGIIKLVPPYSRMAYASRECYYLLVISTISTQNSR